MSKETRRMIKVGLSIVSVGIKIAAVGMFAGFVVDFCTGGATMGLGFTIGTSIGAVIGGAVALAGVSLAAYGVYAGYQNDQAKARQQNAQGQDRNYSHSPSPEVRSQLSSMRRQRSESLPILQQSAPQSPQKSSSFQWLLNYGHGRAAQPTQQQTRRHSFS